MVRQQSVECKLYLNLLGCIKPWTWTSARHYMIKRQSGEAGKVHSLGYVQAEQDLELGLAALLGGLGFMRWDMYRLSKITVLPWAPHFLVQ